MTERREHFALDWIKRELDETLKAARLALEAFAETKGDETRMRACLTHLHQVHGTLLMLELTGVSVLSDEMEQLAQALLTGRVPDAAAAQQSLMQGILQLPGFLEEIQKGLPDSRQAVLPLANELRLARGEKAFADAAQLPRMPAAAMAEGLRRFEQIDGTDKVRKIRAAFQQVLLSILRGQDKRAAIGTLEKIALGLERISDRTPVEPLWTAFGAFVKSLGAAHVALSADIVKLLRRVDAEMKTLAQDGRAALERPLDLELMRALIDGARERGFSGPELTRVAALVTARAAGDDERPGISRREATISAASALREEIAAIKDRLDLLVRGEQRGADALAQLAAPLKQVASTLSILGYESSRAIVNDQVDAINDAVREGRVPDGLVMSAASALLQVDENLAAIANDRNHRFGAHGEASAVIGAAQQAVLAEARNGLEQVKQATVDYVSAQWDIRHLEGVPDLLAAVGGALAMVPLAQAADQLARCGRYVRERLLPGPPPGWTELDGFADAISGVDYFLERLSDDAGMPGQDVLGGVERSLAALGYGEGGAPAPALARAAAAPTLRVVGSVEETAALAEAQAPVARAHPDEPAQIDVPRERLRVVVDEDDEEAPREPISIEEVGEADFDLDGAAFSDIDADVEEAKPPRSAVTIPELELPESALEETPLEAVAPPPLGTPRVERAAIEVDDDIVEIFVEEVGEVLETIDAWLPRWSANFADEAALGEVRRSFHTLKGSGRIVGASLIAELAWSIENMLNRVIDGTIRANEYLGRVTREAVALIPRLRDDFEARRASDEAAVASVMERADVLASGGSLDDVAAPLLEVSEAEPEAAEITVDLDESADAFALFDEESNRHLDVLQARLANANSLDEDVMRALHTLRGGAAMAGIDAVSAIADPVYRVASAHRDAGVAPSSDVIDFLQQGAFALRRTVTALRDGLSPEEDTELFAREAERHLASLAGGTRASALLELEGVATLTDAQRFLEGWRTGSMDVAALSDTIAALHELRNEAESLSQNPLTALCDALLATYARFEGHALDDAAFNAFAGAHEHLLTQLDAIAAEQSVPDGSTWIDALQALAPVLAVAATVVEEDLPQEALAPPEPEMPAVAVDEEDLIELPEFDDIEAFEEASAESPSEPPAPPLVEIRAQQPEPSPEPVPVPEPAAAPPEPAPAQVARIALPEDVDHDILSIFFEEAEELLETMDHGIQDWIDDRSNRVHVEKLLRALHTLKGGARLAGLMDLGEETHAFESFVVAAQEGPFDDAFFAAVHERHDHVTAHVIALQRAASGAPPAAEQAAVAAAPPEPSPAPTAVAPPPKAEREAPEPVREAPTPADAAPADEEESEPESAEVVAFARRDEPVTARGPQDSEMVRVPAQLLEHLVDLAGETSIVRSRVEQGINDFATALDEMETTIERVREQLRRLEIETEAQVLYRREISTGPDYDEFDPLEMDRYSALQQLSRGLSESASDMLDLKETLANKSREAETLLLQQARLNTEIQEGLMRTRMVPFSRLLPRLRRIVRQVARDVGKDVELHVYNAEGELDRNVLERMVPPLEHMLRNAIDHGIERPEMRRSYGKPTNGRIDLRLSREGADVVIEIADDGSGIDVENVRAKAIERGLMASDAALRDDEILQFVLAPGFSTARSVTQISGRGVGMDVVHSAVKQLGGSISIMSIAGRGTRFTIRLPFTVSVNRALMVSVGEDLYAVPLNTIEGIVRVAAKDLDAYYAPDGEGFEYAGMQYRMRYLGSFLGREYTPALDRGTVPVVLVRSGDRAVAVHVDAVQGSREIVVKSLGPQFAGVGGISGATILGDGSVVVILDLLALIRTQAGSLVTVPAEPSERRPLSVMVVDDSVTVRKVTSRLLERQGMDVMLAKDGVEAIAMLQERRPDVVLLDIEMPRMDGFEVARQIRHDERLKKLPIIMITSRTGTKHQERAREIGVNRFLGKPFHESDLLASIDDLVRGTRGRSGKDR